MENVNEALDQAAAESQPGADSAAGSGQEQAIENAQGVQDGGDKSNTLGVEVPPELKEKEKELVRGFHKKMQELSAKEKELEQRYGEAEKDAKTLYTIAQQEWFKKAAEEEKARRRGISMDMTAEQFEEIKNDPRRFAEYLSKRDQAVAESLKTQFKTEFDKLSKSQSELQADREVERLQGKYGDDFVQAKDSGKLDSYLKDGFDRETAYKLLCQDEGRVAGKPKQKEAAPVNSKGGTVEKTGIVNARGGPVVKAKSLDEALDRVFEMQGKGIKDYRLERA
jgi:hypothetical protein